MTETFTMAALWLSFAVVATILANHLKVSMALTEISVGVAAGFVADRFLGPDVLGANVDWLKFLAASGAALLTFLAGGAAEDRLWIRRMRTLTVGFLTPFYFIRVGSLVSLPVIVSGPLVFILLLGGKVASKIFGLYPVIARFRKERSERWYYTLLMSTELTFGTISALYGFTHGIVSREQYSFLVAAVIASAVVPTVIATLAFLPRHLIPASSTRIRMPPSAEVCAPDLNGNGQGDGLGDE